jgi:radical SAM protein with 4Fe4S-binding SPASM domain
MLREDECLQAHPPSLVERRDGRSLFVWGALGQWLVVDAEVASLLSEFSQRRQIGDVIRDRARQSRTSQEAASAAVLPVIGALAERGILGRSLIVPPLRPDTLRIANLTFNITNRCNLHCPWCYNAPQEIEQLPPAELIDWLRAGAVTLAGDATLIILGGEPFLDESRLLETIGGARECFHGEVLVSTNGTRLGPATPAALARLGVTVQISLDGSTAAAHDTIRGAGVFQQALANARRLVSSGVRTVFSMVMARGSEEHFDAYFDLAAQFGVDEVRFIPLRRIGRGAKHSDRAPDLHACFRRLVDLLGRRPELARFLARDFFSILMVACRFSRLRDNCGIGRQSLFVDADGGIYPCPNYRQAEDCCGHLRETPLSSIVEQSAVLCRFRQSCRLAAMPQCRECAFRHWCAGDCRAEADSVAGRQDAPSPYCHDLQRIIPEMFWLIADGWERLGIRQQTLRPWS